jgi:4-hydroxybenzoate polyprenyltransferase
VNSTPPRRSRARAYLLLARVSNLPTVWSNVLAGAVGTLASAVTLQSDASLALPLSVLWVVIAASCFYTGGMFLNDAFDASFDKRHRPDRPIPRGEVGVGEAFAVGAACLALGIALLWPIGAATLWGLVLAVVIVLYDYSHKANPVAPLVMGSCRGLVYVVSASALATIPASVIAGAVVVSLYVAGLTLVAKRAGPDARWLIPALISGISLVDSAFILAVAPFAWPLAAVAALGCPLTLFLQRFVPGD